MGYRHETFGYQTTIGRALTSSEDAVLIESIRLFLEVAQNHSLHQHNKEYMHSISFLIGLEAAVNTHANAEGTSFPSFTMQSLTTTFDGEKENNISCVYYKKDCYATFVIMPGRIGTLASSGARLALDSCFRNKG